VPNVQAEPTVHPVVQEINELSLETLTPMAAFDLLRKWKTMRDGWWKFRVCFCSQRTAYGRVPEFVTLISVVTVVAGDDPVNTNFALTE
jgi:hypothetical protein